MFSKNTLSLGRVYDKITIREGAERLTLHVNADPNRIVVGLAQAQKQLVTISDETPAEERERIALFFAGVIFGEEQAQRLLDYYYGESACVVAICGQYFSKRLSKLITKAQKRK